MRRLGLITLVVASVAFAGGFSGGGGLTGFPAQNQSLSVIDAGSVTAASGKFDVLDAGVLNVQGQETVAGGLYVTGPVSVPQSSCLILDGAATCATAAAKRFVWDGVDIKMMAGASTFLTCSNSTGICSDTFGFKGPYLVSTLADSTTAPTVTGFCTSPSVPSNNGTSAFTINVGSACAASTGTITLPAATTGWVCDCHDVTTPASNYMEQTGGTTTTCTMQNYVRTTGVAGNFTSSDVYRCTARGY